MSAIKRFEPKTFKDLVGNPKAHELLRTYMKDKTHVLLVGDPGVGKTSAARVVAKELGLLVVELNASDQRTKKSALPDMVKSCQQQSPFGEGLMFLLDEVDGMGKVEKEDKPTDDDDKVKHNVWDYVEEILINSKHAVVLTCNDDYKIPANIKKMYMTIKLQRPSISTVQKFAEKVAKVNPLMSAPTPDKLTNDFRNAINVTLFGGETYLEVNEFSQTNRFFVEGVTDRIKEVALPFLFDNAPNYLKGWDMYQFYRILDIATRSDLAALSLCPRGSGHFARFPGYYRMKSGRKKEEEDNDNEQEHTRWKEGPA